MPLMHHGQQLELSTGRLARIVPASLAAGHDPYGWRDEWDNQRTFTPEAGEAGLTDSEKGEAAYTVCGSNARVAAFVRAVRALRQAGNPGEWERAERAAGLSGIENHYTHTGGQVVP